MGARGTNQTSAGCLSIFCVDTMTTAGGPEKRCRKLQGRDQGVVMSGTFSLSHLRLERGTGFAIADSIDSAVEERGITDTMMVVEAHSTV